jgi:hypothetical protein
VLLSARTIKLASITQNNYVYEHTAEGPTPEVLLNIRSPYRRQKRDLSIIRSSFRRPHWNRNTCDYTDYLTFLPITSTTLLPSCDWLLPTSYLPTFLRSHPLFPIFLPFCDYIHYFLPFYLLATASTTSYLPPDHIDYFLPSYLLAATSTTYYRHTYRWPLEKQLIPAQLIKTALDLLCLGMVNNQPIRSALDFHDLRHGKSPTNQNTRD